MTAWCRSLAARIVRHFVPAGGLCTLLLLAGAAAPASVPAAAQHDCASCFMQCADQPDADASACLHPSEPASAGLRKVIASWPSARPAQRSALADGAGNDAETGGFPVAKTLQADPLQSPGNSRGAGAFMRLAYMDGAPNVTTKVETNQEQDDDAAEPITTIVGIWTKQTKLERWKVDWPRTIQDAYGEQWAPPGLVESDLKRARFGRLNGQRVVAIALSCNCSSMSTSVLLVAESGASHVLQADDSITHIEFLDDWLEIRYEDDPEAPNCCAGFERVTTWVLIDGAFTKTRSVRVARAAAS